MRQVKASPLSPRRGGQQLPDDVQDRPEQNAGYDAAVRGDGSGTPVESQDEVSVIDLERGARDAELTIAGNEDESEPDDEHGR